MMDKRLKLSDVIKREIGNKTQAQIAKESGISSSVLNDWVACRRNPGGKNFYQLYKLAKYFSLTLEELLFDERPNKTVVLSQTIFRDKGTEYKISITKVK